MKYYCILYFRYADEIIIGDEILALQNHEVKTVKVIRMSSFIMKGYNHF